MAQKVKNLPAMQETWIWSQDWGDPLEKGMATHSSILVWKIPRSEGPDGLSPWGHEESDTAEQLTLHFILHGSSRLKQIIREPLSWNGSGKNQVWLRGPIHHLFAAEYPSLDPRTWKVWNCWARGFLALKLCDIMIPRTYGFRGMVRLLGLWRMG